MLMNIIKQVNWIDIFILILVIRVCYVAAKSGFVLELFKLLGTVITLYLSMHYYLFVSSLLVKYIPAQEVYIKLINCANFVNLVIIGFFAFKLGRVLFNRLLKVEAVSTLNKWGSLFLGIARSILLASIIMYMLVISNSSYLNKSVKTSYMARRIFVVAPDTYIWLWETIASKFSTTEKYNSAVASIKEDFLK